MAPCEEIRELLGQLLEGGLDDAAAAAVGEHLERCEECSELRDTLARIEDTVAPLRDLEPPAHLASDIAASPCRRWLGLLFSAVDREITQPNLDRLLPHLESCPSCRAAWNDLTLIHQVGDAMVPPRGLLERCITVRRAIHRLRPVLSRRAIVAAAYAVAVLASLTVGNPVSIARSPVVQRVAETVTSGVSEVAEESRGELRVMIWRAWQWGNRRFEMVRNLLQPEDGLTDEQIEVYSQKESEDD